MKILGISLVKNEDLYIKRAVENILDFCDEIIILDNYSSDNTWNIISDLSSKHNHLTSLRWENPMDSGKVLNPYIGEDYWVFGVDGDEIYDREGLRVLRGQLLSGVYKNTYCIKGHCLHCNSINFDSATAEGWDCPPSRAITKLYNFSLIDSYHQNERLHGSCTLKDGYSPIPFNLTDQTDTDWDSSPLRCLHAAFVPRSSLDSSHDARIPPNGNLPFKLEKYRKGPLVSRSLLPFYENIHQSS